MLPGSPIVADLGTFKSWIDVSTILRSWDCRDLESWRRCEVRRYKFVVADLKSSKRREGSRVSQASHRRTEGATSFTRLAVFIVFLRCPLPLSLLLTIRNASLHRTRATYDYNSDDKHGVEDSHDEERRTRRPIIKQLASQLR